MYNWLYITITNKDKIITTCCINAVDITEEDLALFDEFLAFYKYNYSVRNSMFVENIRHVCKNIAEIRMHVIDETVLLTNCG